MNQLSQDSGVTAVAKRWTPNIIAAGPGFTPIAINFLRNYHRLKITHTEAIVLIHVMSYRWDKRPPFPPVPRLARELGISSVQVRTHLRSLERKGFIRREEKPGRPNRLHVDGLMDALEHLIHNDNFQQSEHESFFEEHSESHAAAVAKPR